MAARNWRPRMFTVAAAAALALWAPPSAWGGGSRSTSSSCSHRCCEHGGALQKGLGFCGCILLDPAALALAFEARTAVAAVAGGCQLKATPVNLPVRRVGLAKDLRRAVSKDKHPWLFDRAFKRVDPWSVAEPGGVVKVAWKTEALALGLYDPDSPLRVRLLSWPSKAAPSDPAGGTAIPFPDENWAHQLASRAGELRRADERLADSNGIRLLHGESDGMPGLMLDSYVGHAVAVFDNDACEAFWLPRLAAVAAALVATGAGLRSIIRKGTGELLWGASPPQAPLVMEENGAKFEVDLVQSHKTGFFLDQRDNRLKVRQMSNGLDVLDLFSYTGGFAVSAALGGARRVTAVDISGRAIIQSQRNFALNRLDAEVFRGAPDALRSMSRNKLVKADCWDYLSGASKAGDFYDVVVCDPPSMAPNARSKGAALSAYMRVNEGSMRLLRPGGLLVACSCSSHVTLPDLRAAVHKAAGRAGVDIEIEAEERAASDHPVRAGFPEGDYLQALYIRIYAKA